MLELVDVGRRSLDAYRGIAPDAILDQLVNVASNLRGARVLHVNATPYGGGVSELLRSGVPLLNDLGLVAHWKIIRGDDLFFQVTKKIHNGLQGATADLTEADREAYLDPVCGMSVGIDQAAPEAMVGGVAYRFCSEECRDQFLRDPGHYLIGWPGSRS